MWLRVISVFVPIVLAVASGTALAQQKSSGRALYLEKCAPCHGDEGGGDGPGAKTMLPRPRVFADNSDYKFRTTASGNLPTDADPRTTSVIAGSRLDLLDALEVLGATHPLLVEALVLRDIQELDYNEISLLMDLPLGTVKSRIHQARKTIQPLLIAQL